MTERDSQITFRSSTLQQPLLPEQPLSSETTIPSPKPEKQRLISLDILRGLTMVGMIVVDCEGPEPPWWIKHVAWDGFSPADSVFPSFVFILGMAVPLALSKNKPISLRSLVRILGLFAIGIILNMFDQKLDMHNFRIPGILQRMAICYFLTVLLHWLTRYAKPSYRGLSHLLALGIGLVYLSLMLSYENLQQGCPRSRNLVRKCVFSGHFDYWMMGSHTVRDCDPEGIFTSVNAFQNAYIGYCFCLVMLDNKGDMRIILKIWTIASLIFGALVYPLTFLMPINKRLWSISFVFLTAVITGLSLVFVTLLFDILPKKFPNRYTKITTTLATPFLWLGRNPLIIYILVEGINILMDTWIEIDGKQGSHYFYEKCFLSWIGDGHVASTVYAVFWLGIFVAIAGVLHWKKIFIKL